MGAISKDKICEMIVSTVREIESTAEVILFGSRARGDNRPDSDWDVLVLIDVEKLTDEQEGIAHALMMKGFDIGEEINAVVRTREYWSRNISLFKHYVTNEGIRI